MISNSLRVFIEGGDSNPRLLFFAAALAAYIFNLLLLSFFKQKKIGQSIREEGPQSHLKKAGTPTMGGIGFMPALLVLGFLFTGNELWPVLILTLAFALLGLADDLFKILRKQNMGLTFRQKIILQTIIAAIFCSQTPDLWYFLFAVFIVVGSANAANLTDGLDGLLSGCAIITLLAFAYILDGSGRTLCLISAGSLLGFLFLNFPKARIFMGDTGSLAIGALLGGLAVYTRHEIFLAVAGGVFVVSALSVIIQVSSYKLFKRRVFKMSPLHHHFEQLGFSETRVVLSFWLASAVLAILGVMISGI